jgi:hypothetical protein
LKPNEFWNNTWKENQLLGEAYMIRLNIEWEQTRYLASMLINVNVDKKSKMISPDKLFPLPQDVYLERGKPKSTKEEYDAFLAKLEVIKASKTEG